VGRREGANIRIKARGLPEVFEGKAQIFDSMAAFSPVALPQNATHPFVTTTSGRSEPRRTRDYPL
jgi:hypothetical protein